ncbi:vacuolar ATP synthase catalytic subunit-related / V-ATPase-related / vacuolar proton pump-like protein, partial [Perilla frutescens var. hirtella]
AMAVVQRQSDTREPKQQAAYIGPPPEQINLISCEPIAHISDIKLIRTDTTLDLSQKAEKGAKPMHALMGVTGGGVSSTLALIGASQSATRGATGPISRPLHVFADLAGF